MLFFNVESNDKKLQAAGRLVVDFFKQLKIEDLPHNFNHTLETGPIVYLTIRQVLDSGVQGVFHVTEYSPWNRWTRAIAYAKNGTIFINKYKLPQLEIADYVGNFAHETMHLLGYTHRGNYVNDYNLKTVPYIVGALAEAWCRGHE